MFNFQIIFNLATCSNNKKNLILFLFVCIIAIQALFFISIFHVDIPNSDDWRVILFASLALENKFSFEEIFSQHLEHRPLFPWIIMIPGLLLSNFSISPFLVLGWIFLCLSTFVIYLLLRDTDPRLVWLIIPISAFIFSVFQYSMLLWSFVIISETLKFFAMISAIYFLNSKNFDYLKFSLAVLAGIISTYSAIVGILIWMTGIFSLAFKPVSNKKWLLIWTSITTIVLFSYFYNLDLSISGNELQIERAISFDGLRFFFTYITNPLLLKYEIFRVIFGAISLILIISSLYFLIKIRNKFQVLLPWLQFLFISLLAAAMTVASRIDLSPATSNRYVLMQNFYQISFLVIISMVILELLQKKKKIDKSILIFLILVIGTQFLLITGSNYLGWNTYGEIDQSFKLKSLNCYTLPANISDCSHTPKDHIYDELITGSNFLLLNNYSVFKNQNFTNSNIDDLFKYEIWPNLELTKTNFGKIQYVNQVIVKDTDIFEINNTLVQLQGWLLSDNRQPVEQVYLLLDEELFIMTQPNLLLPEISVQYNIKSDFIGWEFNFLSGYISPGCHDIQIVGNHQKSYYLLDDKITICNSN